MESSAETLARLRVSIIVPMHDEQENVFALNDAIHAALRDAPWPWELIYVDDGSADSTGELLRAAALESGPHVRVVELQRNFGQTAAMQAGIDLAAGDIAVTLDGDLQNDPADIPRMVERLVAENLDLLTGWRKERQDNLWLRTIPSKAANWLIGRITGVHLHDYGCSLKVYRLSVIRSVRLYGDMHRFVPAWAAASTNPSRIREEVVNHRPRSAGESKYGLSRIYRVVLDLLTVFFFMRFMSRPGHFFGRIGLTIGAIGSIVLAYLVMLKIFYGEDIGGRPLLMAGVLMVIVSIQFLTTGLIGEMITRTYFESTNSKPYVIRKPGPIGGAEGEPSWFSPRSRDE